MKSVRIDVRVWVFIAMSCPFFSAERVAALGNGPEKPRTLSIEHADTTISNASLRGPSFQPPEAFYAFESSSSPRIERLRKEYRLEEAVDGEQDEFRRMLQLRHWVHSRWPIDNQQRFSGDALEILEKAKTGAGFQCSHSMRVQHAVMTAMGFVARDLGVDRNDKELGSGHHGVNEVWSNQFAKWVLMDAKYDIHFERDGMPLSALELHEAIRSDQVDEITKVQGPDRKTVPMKGFGYPESNVLSYWWVSYHVALDAFTGSTRDSRLVIFDNDAFRKTTWFRVNSEGLKEHWAYAAKAFIPTDDHHQIDWTPGVPELRVRQDASGQLDVKIHSVTPNLKTYQVRSNDGEWQSVDGDLFRWGLRSGENRIDVRTKNDLGTFGPIVTATLVFTPTVTAWQQIEADFTPPQEFASELGHYRSPLVFADGREVKSADDWKDRRSELLQQWTDLLGNWPPLITEPQVEVLETKRRENFQQLHIRFKWIPNEYTTGYLLIPDGDTPRPAVVTVYYEPETAIGLGKPYRDFAYQLARRGFVTLSLGTTEATAARTYSIYYPNIDQTQVQPLSMLGCAAANAWYVLASRPEVDSKRIGIVGHSFGGKWAMFASCLFDKFACAAWSDPGIVFDEARGSVNYWEPWYLGYHQKPWRTRGLITKENPARGLYPKLVAEGRDLHELHALMAPRPFLVSGGSEDTARRWVALNHTVAVNRLLGYPNRVAMTNRPEHSPNEDSNAHIYAFIQHFLQPAEDSTQH